MELGALDRVEDMNVDEHMGSRSASADQFHGPKPIKFPPTHTHHVSFSLNFGWHLIDRDRDWR